MSSPLHSGFSSQTTRRPTLSRWLVVILFIPVLIGFIATDGVAGIGLFAVVFGVFTVLSALYALALKRPSWLGLHRPASAGRAAGGGVGVFLTGVIVFGLVSDPSINEIPTITAPSASPVITAEPATAEPSTEDPATSLEPTPSIDPTLEEEAAPGTALAQLETVEIKGRAPRTGYDRDLFGRGWKDPDRNGCDARNDMLNRDLTEVEHRPGTHGCIVTSGILEDPFTATTIDFVRGQGTSNAVQIDHVVALSDAWQKGAQQMTPEEREFFANDPLNLLAVDGPANMAKSDSDAATWLPPNRAFWCEFVSIQTAVKAKHDLWMTQAEHDAIHTILSTSCPDQPVPVDAGTVPGRSGR